MSFDEEDQTIWNFMQWCVKEQIEEETLAMDLMNMLKIAGGEKASSDALYSLDRDLGTTADCAISAQDVTADNP
jgi:ferritin